MSGETYQVSWNILKISALLLYSIYIYTMCFCRVGSYMIRLELGWVFSILKQQFLPVPKTGSLQVAGELVTDG